MNKIFKKFISIGIIASSISILPLTGASAEWKQDTKGWWNAEDSSWSKGWKQIDGKWYYFGQDGYMAHDTNIGGYQIDNNGVWVQNTSNTANSNNTSTNVNNINSNNTTNVTNNINNGIIINEDIKNTASINQNNNIDATNTTGNKTFDGTNGFKDLGNNQYVYYENGQMLKNTWKKFDEGYRHFNKDGYMDFNKIIDGLRLDVKGLYPLNNKTNDLIKDIFMTLNPYVTYLDKFGAGDLSYIIGTYDVFGIRYEVQYTDVYDSAKDGIIISIDNSYGSKNSHWSDMNNSNFSGEKIIKIGKYISRIN